MDQDKDRNQDQEQDQDQDEGQGKGQGQDQDLPGPESDPFSAMIFISIPKPAATSQTLNLVKRETTGIRIA